MVSYMLHTLFPRPCCLLQQAQELVLFLFGQPAQILCIPIEKYLVAGPECSLTRRGQPQMITAALLFPGHKAIFHQLDHAALAVAPVQVQVFGHLSRGAAGMFAHVDHKIHHAKAQAKLLQLLGGVGCELLALPVSS